MSSLHGDLRLAIRKDISDQGLDSDPDAFGIMTDCETQGHDSARLPPTFVVTLVTR